MKSIKLPGLIDPHVHLRDPGQTHKEDFFSGTQAAIAGGFTTIVDMPNNSEPIFTEKKLNEKIAVAKDKIFCKLGFYFGSLGDNIGEFEKVVGKVFGLKLYLSKTTGNYIIEKGLLERVFLAWKKAHQTLLLHSNRVQNKIPPILVHADDECLNKVIEIAKKTQAVIHVCHVATARDLTMILSAKRQQLQITCGVTPHHLFLTKEDEQKLGPFGKMKPPLQSKEEVAFLWENITHIDLIESDHAPHTKEEKTTTGDASEGLPKSASASVATARLAGALWSGPEGARLLDKGGSERAAGPGVEKVPFGVPGLETTLPLLLNAVNEQRLRVEDIIRMCHDNPKKIFKIPDDGGEVIVDMDTEQVIEGKNLFAKSKWTPFEGRKVKGKVLSVSLNREKVFEDGRFLMSPGSGKIITP